MDHRLVIAIDRLLQLVAVLLRGGRTLSRHLSVQRWQGTWPTSVDGHLFLFNASEVIFDGLMSVEVLTEPIFV